ncbi:DUF1993 family protein [Vibrio bivalvicida]|uniref:DUF1993 domain-containing protein n=1 Tax=Vibrio bivalvicida TaxID=1276888 RepID=A0A177XXD2_9VIBR|nr:DUF1993 family protein [Vibrio bivalvicida]OAJ93247.1 hypothetical protein APB76_14895 [Vibrio bivalvicida]
MINTYILFQRYLTQLRQMVVKVPSEVFDTSLAEGMFSLEMHAKIAANFTLRGCCPLLGVETVSLFREESGKLPVIEQIDATLSYLSGVEGRASYDDTKILRDKAGFSEVELPESEFIHVYIVPNILFHMSMVYAIAKTHDVPLSKGDFDGLHSYPEGFSFVK